MASKDWLKNAANSIGYAYVETKGDHNYWLVRKTSTGAKIPLPFETLGDMQQFLVLKIKERLGKPISKGKFGDGEKIIDRGNVREPVFAKKASPKIKKEDIVRFKSLNGYISRVPKHNQSLVNINRSELVIGRAPTDYGDEVQIVEYMNIFNKTDYKVQTATHDRGIIIKKKGLTLPQAKGTFYRLNKAIATGCYNLH